MRRDAAERLHDGAMAQPIVSPSTERQFEMSGGYVKNAVLRAAFMSASEGSEITNEKMWRAARAEYEAMGKLSFHR